jgi:hypothetical protein
MFSNNPPFPVQEHHIPMGRLALASLIGAALLMLGPGRVAAAEPAITLVHQGEVQAVIVVADRVLAPDRGDVRSLRFDQLRLEQDRQRLRASVRDLALYIEKMSGAKIQILTAAPPPGDQRTPILVGELAQARFGPPGLTFVDQQAFRVVVAPDAVGLVGESDLATSYAIYEVLDRLGCRWFMPSEMGEHVPLRPTIALPISDQTLHPYTYYRGVWYGDEDYKRRNRLGGLLLNCGHALEMYLTAEDRQANPQWRATIDGLPQKHRLKWSAPGLDEAIAAKIIAAYEKSGTPTFSLSPDDGMGYDNSPEDQALDAGDFDPSNQAVSLADRLIHLCNRIAAIVNARHPDVRFGLLSYTPYARPPVRQTLHPSIIPQIAPITCSRAQPMTDDGEPNNRDFRAIVEGWARQAPVTSYYFYAWFLAEASSPNPMIRKWSIDIPFVYQRGACRFWQPETMPNYETSVHALHLGNRLAWDPTQDPGQVIADLNDKLYGPMAPAMAAYWSHIDACWFDVPEYAGCGFGHLRRWTPPRLAKARDLLDAARSAASSEREKALAEMYHRSLSLFEQFMQMRRDLAEGRFSDLPAQADAYLADMAAAVVQYKNQFAFGSAPWAGREGVNGRYFRAFYLQTYTDAARIATQGQLLTSTLRQWRWRKGSANSENHDDRADGWFRTDFDDSAWSSTDPAVDTWSTLGLHNHLGSAWYRTSVDVADRPAGKRAYLWLGSTDGQTRVWVNGQSVPCLKPILDARRKPTGEFERVEQADGFCSPFSFDITDAVRAGDNQITILARRAFVNELGTGGLLAAPVIYCQ